MNYILSQILGIIVTIFCLISPQLKKKWQMCAMTVLATLLSSVGFLLVGEWSAVGCNIVAIAQAVLRIWHLNKNTKVGRVEIAIFSILYIAGGLLPHITAGELSEFGWLDLMPILGALMLMAGIAQRSEQRSRYFGLLNTSIYFTYNAIIMNTQIFAQAAGIVSTSIAIYRYRKKKVDKETVREKVEE